jgi:hypothetical protein
LVYLREHSQSSEPCDHKNCLKSNWKYICKIFSRKSDKTKSTLKQFSSFYLQHLFSFSSLKLVIKQAKITENADMPKH